MVVVNFSHPLTQSQQAQIEALTGRSIARIIDLLAVAEIDNARALAPQIRRLADAAGLSGAEWQSAPLLINPPAYAPAATTMLAELHGRMGHFPSFIRIRPLPGTTPTEFEVAEVINLQTVRSEARRQRVQS